MCTSILFPQSWVSKTTTANAGSFARDSAMTKSLKHDLLNVPGDLGIGSDITQPTEGWFRLLQLKHWSLITTDLLKTMFTGYRSQFFCWPPPNTGVLPKKVQYSMQLPLLSAEVQSILEKHATEM